MDLEDEREVLSDDDIMDMQQMCPFIRELKECVLSGCSISEWPQILDDYKRYAKKLIVCMGIIYFMSESGTGECMYVPVMSVGGVISLTFEHLGKHKLWQLMRECVFSPYLRTIVLDVSPTCERCQRYKIQGVNVKPPLLKVDAKEPFELVVIDCVSMPRTSKGSIGMVVIVDHKSKFAYAAPLRNKSSEHVAEIVQMRLLPMMVRKPKRWLSDNGGEFIGEAFEDLLQEMAIRHITITPYMSSSNGLAERTIRTLTEMLRVAGENGNEWDVELGRVLWCYNATKHAAHGTSPCQFLLEFERRVKLNASLGESEREFWRESHERFRSFNLGEKVLKVKQEIGRLNVYKLSEKFEGPFTVVKVWENGLTYIIERMNENGMVVQVRAHQSQLRHWRDPPEYLKAHPVYELGKKKDSEQLRRVHEEKKSRELRGRIVVCEKSERKRKVKTKNVGIQVCLTDSEENESESSLTEEMEGEWIEDEMENEFEKVNVEPLIAASTPYDSQVEDSEEPSPFQSMDAEVIWPRMREEAKLIKNVRRGVAEIEARLKEKNDRKQEEERVEESSKRQTRSAGPVGELSWVQSRVLEWENRSREGGNEKK